jgi:hypothetical protein
VSIPTRAGPIRDGDGAERAGDRRAASGGARRAGARDAGRGNEGTDRFRHLGVEQEALATADSATRHKDYTRIQEILLEGAVNLFTVQPYKFQVIRKHLTGMYVSYTDFNEGLERACVSEE